MTSGSGTAEQVTDATPRRLNAIDALRALALLGILTVNIWYFAYPEMLEGGMRNEPVESSTDQLVRWIATTFFESKSYVVFSFLFGLSFVLSWASAHRAGVSETGRSIRRFSALVILGLAHGMFLFAGDILLAYGILGFLLLGMRRIRTRWAVIIAVTVFLLWGGFQLVSGMALSSIEGTEHWDDSMAPAVADAAEAQEAFTASLSSWFGFHLAAYSYLLPIILLGQGPMAFGAFLIGLVVGRSQLIERILERQIPTRRLVVIMVAALVVGLTMSISAAVLLWGPPGSTEPAAATSVMMGQELTAMGIVFIAGPIQATGYVLAALLIFRSAAVRPVVSALAPAGRMSLTNYLTQSVVMVLIFTGLGFGLAGEVSAVTVGVMIALIWGSQLVLSSLWFRRFKRGPLEEPMRRWTYGAT